MGLAHGLQVLQIALFGRNVAQTAVEQLPIGAEVEVGWLARHRVFALYLRAFGRAKVNFLAQKVFVERGTDCRDIQARLAAGFLQGG